MLQEAKHYKDTFIESRTMKNVMPEAFNPTK